MKLSKKLVVLVLVLFLFVTAFNTTTALFSRVQPEFFNFSFLFICLCLVSLFIIIAVGIKESKKETKYIENKFAEELLRLMYNDVDTAIDEAVRVIETHKENSKFARTFSSLNKYSMIDLIEEIRRNYLQRDIQYVVNKMLETENKYLALGALLRHLIHHKKLPLKVRQILEENLYDLMPTKDILEKYEHKVK